MSSRVSILFIVGVFGFCLAMLYWLLLLEFEAGDAYPEFSSYRPDPLGVLALREALDALPGPEPMRSLVPIDQAVLPDDATLLFAGALPSPDPVKTLEHLEGFVERGGRLVVLLRPESSEDGIFDWDDDEA